MHERLQLLLKYYGLTSSRFADMVGIQPSAVSHLISGRNKPGFDILSKILTSFPELDPRWLILGEGDMLIDAGSGISNTTRISDKTLQGSLYKTTPPVDKRPGEIANGPELFPHEASEKTGQTDIKLSETSSDNDNAKVSPGLLSKEPQEPTSGHGSEIARIIILYSDGTFDSFDQSHK